MSVKLHRRVLFLGLLSSVISLACQGDECEGWVRAKGVFLSRPGLARPSQAVQFFAVLSDRGQKVSTEHQFHSGDRLSFQFALKRSAYIYVLNATVLDADPSELRVTRSKGIVTVHLGDQPRPVNLTSWHLLLPVNAAQPFQASEGVTTNGAIFEMDETPGLELLSIIVSPRPLDIALVVPGSVLRRPRESATAYIRDGGLSALAANCEVYLAPPNFVSAAKVLRSPEKESYVVAKYSERPFAFQVSLRHFPR